MSVNPTVVEGAEDIANCARAAKQMLEALAELYSIQPDALDKRSVKFLQLLNRLDMVTEELGEIVEEALDIAEGLEE